MLGLQEIVFPHLGHVEPVHAAHEFAPPQNLSNKTFGAGHINPALAVSGLSFLDHLQWVQQMQVD